MLGLRVSDFMATKSFYSTVPKEPLSNIIVPLFLTRNGNPEAEVVLLNLKLYIVETQVLRAEGAQMWF